MIYNRIMPTINATILIEQAGFRPNQSCCDQVLFLTTYIEAGFEMGKKIATTFIDLTAAYDTVWRKGFLLKFLLVIPCKTLSQLLNNLLSDRFFVVNTNNSKSKKRRLNNGLPQGSVLAPLLFNLYINDIPETISKKFVYADHIGISCQETGLDNCEQVLNSDLQVLSEYFTRWKLRPNTNKTEVSTFHLNNKQANDTLNVMFNEHNVKHNTHPKYLGVTLDRTLSYKSHLANVAAKINSRNNVIQKLTGTEWGTVFHF